MQEHAKQGMTAGIGGGSVALNWQALSGVRMTQLALA